MARLTATLKEVATFNPRLGAKLIQISETYYKIINDRKRKYALFQCESCLEKFERRVDNVGKKCVICHNIEIAKLNLEIYKYTIYLSFI